MRQTNLLPSLDPVSPEGLVPSLSQVSSAFLGFLLSFEQTGILSN